MQRSWIWLVLLALTVFAVGCAEDEKDTDNNNPPPVNEGELTPEFEPGQTWTVAVSYRQQGIKIDEELKAINDEFADPTSVAEVFKTAPAKLVPPADEKWTEPLYWTFGVINTNYIPEPSEDFYQYSVDADGEAQPITIVKVVADKDLNVVDINTTLDPVFYIVLNESDMRVRGIHYNYKVKEGRNTVVLDLGQNETGMPAPGADQSFFLVPYLLPSFPLDNAADEGYIVEFAEGAQSVEPMGTAAVATFDLSFSGGEAEQMWSEDSPWFDYSIAGDQRAWRLTPDQVAELGGSSVASSVDFLEPAEAIAEKFRNPIRLDTVLRVEPGQLNSSVPSTHVPWSGDYWSLKRGSAIFGWSNFDGRDMLENGPATSIKAEIQPEMEDIDRKMDEIRDAEKGTEEYDALVDEYWDIKNGTKTKINDHFASLSEQYRNGDLPLTQEMLRNLGPLEKYDLYVIANKLQRDGYDNWGAAKWHIENQWNPAGPGWWGHCNGWAAGAILTEQPVEDLSVSLPLENVTGAEEDLTLTFEPGDLKALISLSYYSGYSHFYGERYNGEEQDIDDLHPDVFHRIITYYIGQEKFPLVFDTTKSEEVWNFPAYAYQGEIVAETDWEGSEENPEWTQAYRVTMEVTFGTDSVDEDYVATDIDNQQTYTQNYEYLLFANDDGRVLGGEWVSDAHPDFAWVPYANNTRFSWRSNENPELIPAILENLYELREDAPQVCNPDANDGAGDCSGGLVCSAVDGTCVEGEPEPPIGEECAGAPDRAEAPTVEPGTQDGLNVCSNVRSWFRIDLAEGETLTATVNFQHADGDIDVELVNESGDRLASSTSTTNQEAVAYTASDAGAVYVGIYGYNGDANSVSLVVDLMENMQTGCVEEEQSDNDTVAMAPAIGSGSFEGGICGDDADFFTIEGSGEFLVFIRFTHALGDLDLASVSAEGEVLDSSESVSDEESLVVEGGAIIKVYGYDGATNSYSLTVE